jgi:hypothetical protein
MAQNPKREIDRTHLDLDLAEERGLLHRDYLAHCLRWSHAAKYLNQGHRYKDAIVLDVGCGKVLPLAKLLYVNKMSPKQYVGVDMNKLEIPEMLRGKKIPMSVWSETDICALDGADVGLASGSWEGVDIVALNLKPGDVDMQGAYYGHDGKMYELPNVLVCLEMLEHVRPAHTRAALIKFLALTSNDCHYFISTPCYNGSAAGNHISEITFSALGSLFEDLGYRVESVNGTFASISDYRDELSAVTVFDKNTGSLISTTDLRDVFNALRNYYDTNVLSVIFAPLFPASSRNCLWHLTRKRGDAASQQRLFSALENAPEPWTSSPDWRDLNDG